MDFMGSNFVGMKWFLSNFLHSSLGSNLINNVTFSLCPGAEKSIWFLLQSQRHWKTKQIIQLEESRAVEKRDGREESVKQVLPPWFWSIKNPSPEAAQEPADQSSYDAPYEHQMQYLWQLHLQRDQIQFPQRRCHRRGIILSPCICFSHFIKFLCWNSYLWFVMCYEF